MRLHQFAYDLDKVTYEILMTSIGVNKDFQNNTLNRQNLSLDFIQDDILEDIPLAKRAYPFSPTEEPQGQRTPYPKFYPSESFDPSRSELKFNWSQPPSAASLQPFLVRNRPADDSGEIVPVDVFADAYYLGQVGLNPWSITCDRSPDGRILAFVTNIGEEGSSRPTLGWIDLFNVSDIRFPTLDILPGWEIAFSPDSQNIAFQGCIEQECGIYILNVNTFEIEKISLGKGKYITWSRDGDYLAWIEAGSTPTESGVNLVNIKKDETLYFNDYSLEQDEFFNHEDFDQFGIEFEEQEFGLVTCSLPR